MTTPALSATNLTKRYRTAAGVRTGVDQFDLVLAGGEVVVLTGPSGSGETTIIHLLAGWEQPDSGTSAWPDGSPTRPSWQDVAVIPQALALLDELTVAENITLPIRAAHQSLGLVPGWAKSPNSSALLPSSTGPSIRSLSANDNRS